MDAVEVKGVSLGGVIGIIDEDTLSFVTAQRWSWDLSIDGCRSKCPGLKHDWFSGGIIDGNHNVFHDRDKIEHTRRSSPYLLDCAFLKVSDKFRRIVASVESRGNCHSKWQAGHTCCSCHSGRIDHTGHAWHTSHTIHARIIVTWGMRRSISNTLLPL